jgi:hypothetical protein
MKRQLKEKTKFKIYKSKFSDSFLAQYTKSQVATLKDFPWIVKIGDKEIRCFHSWIGAMKYVRIKLGIS